MIIAIANQKGGVTKTTSTYNLATALSKMGKSVLMIDLDPQASLTISAGLEPEQMEKTIVNVLRGTSNVNESAIQISDNLFLLSSIIDLAAEENNMMAKIGREGILKRALKDSRSEYDYILIDCSPSLQLLTINALTACDYVLIPCTPTYLAYRGLEQLQNTIQEIKELSNENIKSMGVIATLFEKSVADHKLILEEMEKRYDVLGVIKKTVQANKGLYDGKAVVEHNPNSDVAKEYVSIAEKIVNDFK